MTNQFGTYISPSTVEKDMIEHLQFWMPTYLGQMERDMGLPAGSLRVENWTTKTKFENFPEEQIPMVVIVSPGTHGKPYKQGRTWTAKWVLRITAICSAADEETTKELAHAYLTAIRLAILQYQKINGNEHVEGAEWDSDNYNLIGADQTRTIGASQGVFFIEYKAVADESEGPAIPTPTPETPQDPGEWPKVGSQGAKVTITKEPLSGTL